ncbi:MAG: pirin family protein [Tissierellia bacterium]|nr:pirin family protein [Tissierellia bacterium]
MKERKILKEVVGYQTQDGAGVKLTRVLSNRSAKDYDPILMLDSFDSKNPDDYMKGFPFHPHRGIETISYMRHGAMSHRDHLGNSSTVRDGGIQWMTAGSGIIHEETPHASDRMLGVQVWLNMRADDKMADPAYFDIPSEQIEEVEFEGGYLRVLSGSYKDVKGFYSGHHPLDFYSLNLEAGTEFTLETDPNNSVTLFTLEGEIEVAGKKIEEKTAVLTEEGDFVKVKGIDKAEVLVLSSPKLNEPIHWGGPIVMSTRKDLIHAFEELEDGTFIKVNAK